MTRALFLLGLLFAFFSSGALAHETVTLGMRLAAKGEIRDKHVVQQLKALQADKKADASDRIMAAFLLTHAEPSLLGGPSVGYVDYLLAQPGTERAVGAQGMARLYRLKGDYEYQRGKFDLAIPCYEKLLADAKSGMRDYAVLKLGWSHLNRDDAEKALALWLAEAREAIATKRPVSQNLFHGLGQALTEKLDRSGSDVSAVGALTLNEDQRQAVVKGIVDGLNYLSTPALVEKWVASLGSLPFRDRVARRAFEVANVKSERACALLGASRGLPFSVEDSQRVITLCSEDVLKGVARGDRASESLDTALASLPARGEQRYPRFRFLRFRKRWSDACHEGLSWLDDLATAKKGQAPVQEIAASCHEAVAADSGVASQLVTRLETRLATSQILRNADEPVSFIVNALLDVPAFVGALADSAARPGNRFAPTIVPTLLAERLVARGELDRAESIRTAIAPAGKAAPTQGVWTELRYRKIAKAIEGGNLEEAKRQLDADFPLAAPHRPPSQAQALWLALTVKSAQNDRKDPWLAGVLAGMLAARREGRFEKPPTGFDATLWEASARAGLWAELWPVLKGASAEFPSERFEADLFEAVVTRQVPAVEADTKRPGALGRLSSAALPLAADPQLVSFRPGKAWASYPGKTALAKDLRYAHSVSQRERAAIGKKGDSVAQLTAWVNFLRATPREVADRPWACPSLRRAGAAIVADFCRKAQEGLPRITPPEGLPADEWKNLTGSLSDRLAECLRTHERPVADGAAPAVEKKNQGGAE